MVLLDLLSNAMCMTRKKETHKVSLKDFDDARKIWETVHREVIILVENGWEVLAYY